MADMAATEIVDLVEKVYLSSANHKETHHMEDRSGVFEQDNMKHVIAESTSAATKLTPQDSSDIPAWVLAESEMSREVTPPTQFFFSRPRGTTRWRLRPRDCHRDSILHILPDGTQMHSTGVVHDIQHHPSVCYRPPSATNTSSDRPGGLQSDRELTGGTT